MGVQIFLSYYCCIKEIKYYKLENTKMILNIVFNVEMKIFLLDIRLEEAINKWKDNAEQYSVIIAL